MSKMRALADDADYYHEAFNVYHRVGERKEIFSRWVSTELREICQGLHLGVTDKDPVRVLSVGPGDGEIESEILRVVRDNVKPSPDRVLSTAVEPAADKARLFKERMAQEKGIEVDCRVQTLQDYQNAAENQTARFHFISSVHSIYYVPDLKASIKDLYERLEPGGMMLIVLMSLNHGITKIRERFPEVDQLQKHLPSSADVAEACQGLGLAVDSQLPVKIRADVTACFPEPGAGLSEDGRLLLSFVTHVMHFVRDAPETLRKELVEFLGTEACTERGSDGRVFFVADWDVIIIKRSS